MSLKEIKQNLFTAPIDYALAHCVAKDFLMGAGIAVEFKKRYGSIQVLFTTKKRSWSSCSTTKRKVNFLHRY